jgi:Fuc2NAc and GlcNAc transferase
MAEAARLSALFALIVAAGFVSFAVTWYVRRYALRRGLLDHPNERSSHELPTPRGGGVAIVIAFLAGLPVLWSQGALSTDLFAALFGAGIWIALVGFVDDHRPVPARWRLAAHVCGALWVLFWLGPLPPLVVAGVAIAPAWVATAAAAIYIVWVLNLYNFMDGIDGIASIEAITVSLAGGALYWLSFPGSTLWAASLLLLAAVAGFLCWNYPPARVFMGDAGSGFLGVVLAAFAVHSVSLGQRFFWAWTILLGVFVVDATTTLLRRLWRGERLAKAHRSHAYQYASRLRGHAAVSLMVGAVSLCWLFPMALLVAVGWLDGAAGLLLAYAPLVLAAFVLKAGARELQDV